MRSLRLLAMASTVGLSVGCASSDDATKRDYELISGTWRLSSAVVDGRPVPPAELKNTILITDGDTFRFPQDSAVGTHPEGKFTIDPSTDPKQVDSEAKGGANSGQVTLGIYEILDPNHKRACWGPPGGPRPTEFQSLPGSHRILQYWEKIGPVPKQ